MTPSPDRLRDLLAGMQARRVAVLADLVADEYLLCETDRISREAPAALILRYQETVTRPGGGANAAANLRSLGAEVAVVGVVGDDAAGGELVAALETLEIDTSGIIVAPAFHTVIKTRVLTRFHHSTRQQVLRIDREDRLQGNGAIAAELIERIVERVQWADGLLVSDYGYGAASPTVARQAVESGRSRQLPVTLDSRYRLLEHGGVHAATPNEPEVEAALGVRIGDDLNALAGAGEEIRSRLGAAAVVVTRGSKGMALFEKGEAMRLIPVHGSDQIADVTGAGDTVIAAFTLALAAGASHLEAAHLANVAGGVVVMKAGTALVTHGELLSAIAS